MASNNWTKDQTKLAFHLYCQLAYGQLDQRNKEVITLSGLIGRTPSAVAMKMCNIASIDPAVRASGRAGLGNASVLDKEVWAEFHADWERLALECNSLKEELSGCDAGQEIDANETIYVPESYIGETKKVFTEQRVKQNFFRKAVLSGYRGRCCMSGLSDSRLLIASHIVPWSKDKANRLNPSNGLCLSAIHDKAFDKGLISLTDDLHIVLSDEIKKQNSDFYKYVFNSLENRPIEFPEKFMPDKNFVSYHRVNIFLG